MIKLPTPNVYQITSQLNARSDSLHHVREAMQANEMLAILKYTINQGWPSSINEFSSEIQPFWTFREELTIEDGLIKEQASKKQDTILKLIHEGHLGLIKCKLCAKETVY